MIFKCDQCNRAKEIVAVAQGSKLLAPTTACVCGGETFKRMFREQSLARGVTLYRDARARPFHLWTLRQRDMTFHRHHPEGLGEQSTLDV